MNPLLLVWNRQEVAVKPFAYFYIKILMVLEASGGCCESFIDGLESPRSCCEAILIFYNEIFMVSEASGSCCESIIDGLASRGGCCEATCTRLKRNLYGFGSFRRLL